MTVTRARQTGRDERAVAFAAPVAAQSCLPGLDRPAGTPAPQPAPQPAPSGLRAGRPLPEGVRHLPGHLDAAAQAALLADVHALLAAAPAFTPVMPRTGRAMSVRMTNAGPLGWVTDRARGYRYQGLHPETGAPWPPIPPTLLSLWRQVAGWPDPPQACLVNLYGAGARMGMHQDRDEQALDAPVLSVSLGDAALFRVSGTARGGPSAAVRLLSGDVLVLGGPARLAFHGIDRTYAGTSPLPGLEGRINLTLRRVTSP